MPFIACHVCLRANRGLPRGIEHLRGLGLEIGPICNFEKKWDCFAINKNWTYLKIKGNGTVLEF